MTFNSAGFLIFFPVVLLLYFLLPKKLTWIWLLAASYWFYMSWNRDLVFLILFTTAVSYSGGLVIEKSRSAAVKKASLAVTVVSSLGVLFFFKYFNFLTGTLNRIFALFGGGSPLPALDLILPVGISFYTFQTLSYAIDVYRGKIAAERHFGYYALYVSFFPQLVAGPIERPENLLPQLREKHPLRMDDALAGLKKMVVGFFKKVVVADMLAPLADGVFASPAEASGAAVLLACLAFTVQIYCDFSGYTDIAIGCARIMGIRLMQNFDLPYGARSIKEFWAKWHISLSSWFRDYLYIPLGGNRCSRARHLCNLMTVFLVSGLWHGASWHFVLWGGLHGLYQVIGILTRKPKDRLLDLIGIKKDGRFYRAVQRVTTFLLVAFAWLLFRADSTADMLTLAGRLFTAWTAGSAASSYAFFGSDPTKILLCAASVFVMALMDRSEHSDSAAASQTGFNAAKLVPYLAAVWVIAFSWINLQASGGSGTFIYFQF